MRGRYAERQSTGKLFGSMPIVPALSRATALLTRLRQDCAGNTLAMIAAAVFPLLGMVGGGIDMGRSYLSQSRLQQACDSGVLAARKKLGSQVVTTGVIPDDVGQVGNRFFSFNFRDGSYGTAGRSFAMTIENDYAISGSAKVIVPTTIMSLFGYSELAIGVTCQAKLNYSNTDIMFVLDTTGSMAETNTDGAGIKEPKIDSMRRVVKSFHAQLEGSKTPGTVIRYGFLPYATNVNVGALLDPEWMVTKWKYQSRAQVPTGSRMGTYTYWRGWDYVSGTESAPATTDTYAGTYHPAADWSKQASTTVDANENVVNEPASSGTYPAYYTCDKPNPASNDQWPSTAGTTRTEPFVGPPVGTRTITPYTFVGNGNRYSTTISGNTCNVSLIKYTDYTVNAEEVTDPTETPTYAWHYAQLPKDVSNWAREYNGCIEERATYEINDYNNVDLSKAIDLDIDLVPTSDDNTKWRPMYPSLIYARSLKADGSGSFTKAPQTTQDEYVAPAALGLAGCPAAARKLAPMSVAEVSDYLANLTPNGATYHDIGMIWGGRLLSPTGLYASENAEINGNPTSRQMIFLTDGLTQTIDLSYGAYGLEPLDQRRWKPGANLNDVVEKRFGVACSEVKKRNITVWVIGFATNLNPIMTQCAGPGHFFEARDSAELSAVFSKIASQLGELRLAK